MLLSLAEVSAVTINDRDVPYRSLSYEKAFPGAERIIRIIITVMPSSAEQLRTPRQ